MLQRRDQWPPDYARLLVWRMRMLEKMRDDDVRSGAYHYYRDNPADWISHWVNTYDPRNALDGSLTKMPFVLFDRQRQLVDFLEQILEAKANGLVEKSRDMGATWVAVAYSVWLWLFRPGAAIGFGSRKALFVDRLGDPDSIFEKVRKCVEWLPAEFRPSRYTSSYMKLINHDNDASITGESGDEIGRGGRKLIYFKDESAHYEHPESIEAALSENTNVQVDISSVNGVGNVFHRKREAGVLWEPGSGNLDRHRTHVFVFDWRDHPVKTIEWYESRRAKFEGEGLQHVFAQEVDRNYSAAVQNTILRQEWIRSAVDAHVKLRIPTSGSWFGGLDVADGGGDRNALVKRRGIVLRHAVEWGERDTGVTARRAVQECADTLPIEVQYDCVGVGSGVKAETNRLLDEKIMPHGISFQSWDAGAGVLLPDERVIPDDADSPLNRDYYSNLKAQAWWSLRCRFERTHRAVTEGIKYDADDLISLPSDLPLLRQIEKELLQPTVSLSSRNMKLLVDKAPEGTRSPNVADAIVMCYFPANIGGFDGSLSWV